MKKIAEFLVVDDQLKPILGLENSISFGLIKRLDVSSIACLPQAKERFLAENEDVLNGLGKFPGKFKIHLKENAQPVLHYKKRIPVTLVEKFKLEICSARLYNIKFNPEKIQYRQTEVKFMGKILSEGQIKSDN